MVRFTADSADQRRRSGIIAAGIEQNTLAILDETQDSQHTHDDRVAYLEAVRASSRSGIPPTHKMLEAIFRILRMGKSLELIMSSFQLLIELEKRFPRVYVLDGVESSPSTSVPTLVVEAEAWSPFTVGSESASIDRAAAKELSVRPLDPLGFQLLLEELLGAVNDTNVQALGLQIVTSCGLLDNFEKNQRITAPDRAQILASILLLLQPLRNMLLFQYLVEFLEGEHICRCNIYKETKDWAVIREFTLNMFLGSRRINHKSIMKACVSLLCAMHQIHGGITSLPIALLEVAEGTSIYMQKFMKMVMELDALKGEADQQGYTTRADGIRTPLVEIILDELTYDNDIISPFLQAFNQPKWKLEIILQYISKYMPKVVRATLSKPSVRTRRSTETADVGSFGGFLQCLSHAMNAKAIVRKIGVDVVQVLTAHGFQAYLDVSEEGNEADGSSSINGNVGNSSNNSMMEICKGMISSFSNLNKTCKDMEILPIAKEALFVAASLVSVKS